MTNQEAFNKFLYEHGFQHSPSHYQEDLRKAFDAGIGFGLGGDAIQPVYFTGDPAQTRTAPAEEVKAEEVKAAGKKRSKKEKAGSDEAAGNS